jgi:antitoxin VapB
MAISVKSADAENLARKLSGLTGESLTAAIVTALRERLERLERAGQQAVVVEQLNTIARRCAELPVLDTRTAEEIIGYDEHGVPR